MIKFEEKENPLTQLDCRCIKALFVLIQRFSLQIKGGWLEKEGFHHKSDLHRHFSDIL